MRHRILTFIAVAVLFISPFQTANALGPGAALVFADGAITCEIGGTPPSNCDLGLTRVIGSYFAIDSNVNGTVEEIEKTPILVNEGIIIGITQPAFGSHSGCTFGTETPYVLLVTQACFRQRVLLLLWRKITVLPSCSILLDSG